MDFVTQKALEAKVKNIGKDIGLTSGQSSRDPTWSIFRAQESGQTNIADELDNETFPYDVANFYDNCPRNFPPCIKLFYVDRSILSAAAKVPVKWTYRTYLVFQLLLLYNTALAITFTIFDKGITWPNAVVSGAVTIILTIIQLYAFEVSFRGAYRTSKALRQRYIGFAITNIILIALYACLSVSFFNGWQQISKLKIASDLKLKSLRIVLVVVETIGWTVLLFVNTFTLFEYYHLMKGCQQGLSDEAVAAATQSSSQPVREEQERQTYRDLEKAEQMREIREKYQTDIT